MQEKENDSRSVIKKIKEVNDKLEYLDNKREKNIEIIKNRIRELELQKKTKS